MQQEELKAAASCYKVYTSLYDRFVSSRITEETCDLIDCLLQSIDRESKVRILKKLFPDTTDAYIGCFLKECKPVRELLGDYWNVMHPATPLLTVLLNTREKSEREIAIDAYLAEVILEKYKGRREQIRQELFQIPYCPLDETARKLTCIMSFENHPYPLGRSPKRTLEMRRYIPLRERIAIKLMDMNYELNQDYALELADLKIEEARHRALEGVGIGWYGHKKRSPSNVREILEEARMGNIPQDIVIERMRSPELSEEEIKKKVYGDAYYDLLTGVATHIYSLMNDFTSESDFYIQEGVDWSPKSYWTYKPLPKGIRRKDMTDIEIYEILLEELICCYDFGGGLEYAYARFPEESDERIERIVERVFDRTHNLMCDIWSHSEHLEYHLKNVLEELFKE